jgi:hypothetical protein
MRNGGRPYFRLSASVSWHRFNAQRLGLRPMSNTVNNGCPEHLRLSQLHPNQSALFRLITTSELCQLET